MAYMYYIGGIVKIVIFLAKLKRFTTVIKINQLLNELNKISNQFIVLISFQARHCQNIIRFLLYKCDDFQHCFALYDNKLNILVFQTKKSHFYIVCHHELRDYSLALFFGILLIKKLIN